MKSFSRFFSCSAALVLLVFAGPALAQAPPSQSQHAGTARPYRYRAPAKPSIKNHMRLKRDADGQPLALQTSIVRYVPAEGNDPLTVDLISAVHIGDRAYYEKLNRIFDRYDVVLYELVAPPDRRIPQPDAGSDNPLRMIQKLSQSVLDLEHQLDHIDYTKPNFVHADLSPQEMADAMRKRGDDAMTVMLGVIADMMRQQNRMQQELERNPEKLKELEEIDIFQLLTDPYGAVKLKRIMAEQFADLTGLETGVGSTLDRILIKDRNAAAIRALQKQLVRGKKRIAIFYGAAHMPDFETRLTRDFGMKRKSIQWITAWDLRMKAKSPAEGLLGQLLQSLMRP